MRVLWLVIAAAVLVGCGESNDTSSTGSGAGNLECQTDATASADTAKKTIVAAAMVSCGASADVTVKLCVQSNAGGAWTDLMCQSASASNKEKADVSLVASCGAVTSGRSYRATASTSARDGTTGSVDLATSAEVSCD